MTDEVIPFSRFRGDHPLEKLGVGARRVCYRIVGTGCCVKFLRTEEDDPSRPLGWKMRRMLKDRFNRRRNLNCLEAEAMNRYRELAGPRIAAALPERVEIVLDEKLGYGVLMSELRNADGSGVKSSIIEMLERGDHDFARETFRAMREHLEDLIAVSAPFYESDNFVTQFLADGSWRLRIIDFEPVGKKLLSPERWFAPYRRWFVRRQSRKVYAKYARRIGIEL